MVAGGATVLGASRAVKQISIFCLLAVASISFATALEANGRVVDQQYTKDWLDALPPAAAAVCAVTIATGMTVNEATLAPLCGISGLILVASSVVYYKGIYGDSEKSSLGEQFGASAVFIHVGMIESLLLLLIVVSSISAQCALLKAQKKAKQEEVRAQNTVLETAAVLDSELAMPRVLQLLGEMQGELSKSVALCHFASSRDQATSRSRAVANLDRVLMQAAMLETILRRKAEEWGLLSHGCLPIKTTGGACLVTCDKIANRRELAELVLRPPVKTRLSALRELGLCASSVGIGKAGPELLVDCCKSSLYFRDMGGVLALLEALRRDPELKIVAVRNRMGLSRTNSKHWLIGEKSEMLPWCVALNLLISNDETRKLGLDGHLCELQLFLSGTFHDLILVPSQF